MNNEKFLLEWMQHLSNRPFLFFLVWGGIVVFFLYLFWGLKRGNNKRYFREDSTPYQKPGNSIQRVEEDKNGDLVKKD